MDFYVKFGIGLVWMLELFLGSEFEVVFGFVFGFKFGFWFVFWGLCFLFGFVFGMGFGILDLSFSLE